MSFLTKTDYYGLAGDDLVIVSSDENKSASTAQARDYKGDIVKEELYGEISAPSCSYVLKGDYDLGSIKLGEPITNDSKYFVINNVSISTSAGTPPTIQVSGEEVPNGSHCGCTYTSAEATVEVCHHAQTLFSAFTLSGTGFYLTSANYTIECGLTKATKDGETVAYDVSDGKITCSLTIQGTGGNGTPSITKGTGWEITSPLTMSNPDSGYETYTVTLTKNLTHDTTT